MGFDLWAPLNWEQGQLLRQQNLRSTTQQFAQQAQDNPHMVSAIVGNRRMYPWMAPGAQASLGFSGLDPSSLVTQMAARLAAEKALQTGQWATQGQWTDGSSEQAGAVASARSVMQSTVQAATSGLAIGKGSSQIPSSALPSAQQHQPSPNPSQIPNLSASIQGAGSGQHSGGGGFVNDIVDTATAPARAAFHGAADVFNAGAGLAQGAIHAASRQAPAALSALGHQVQAAGRLTGPQSDTPYSMAHAQQQRAADVASLQQGPGPAVGLAASVIPGGLAAAKGISRGAFMAANMPYEAVSGIGRQVAGTGNDIYNLAAGNQTFGQVGGDLLNRAVPGGTLAVNALTGGRVPTHAPIWGGAQTQGGQALIDLWNGRRVDTGSGFFPDIASKTAKEAGAAAQAEAPTINGHAFTPGRAIASIFSPDTVPYDLLSGSIDAAAQFSKLNPANMAFEPITAAIQNRNLVSGYQTPAAADAATKLATAQDATSRVAAGQKIVDSLTGQITDLAARPVGGADGAFPTIAEKQAQIGQVRDQLASAQRNLEQIQGVQQTAQGIAATAHGAAKEEALAQLGATSTYRKAVDRPTAYQAIVGDKMQGVVKALTPINSPAEIWRASGGKITPEIAAELAAAKTDVATEQVFASHLGSDINPMPTVKTTGVGTSRLGEYLKASTVPNWQPVNAQRDLNDGLPKIDQSLRIATVPQAERNAVFDQYAAARTPGEFFAADDAYVQAARKPIVDELVKLGVPRDGAEQLAAQTVTAYRDSINSMHVGNAADIVDNAAGPVYGVTKGPNGDLVYIHKPMVPEEFLHRNLILADPNEMRQLARHPAMFSLAKVQQRAEFYTSKIGELQSKLATVDAVAGGPTDLATAGDTRASLQTQLEKYQELQAKNEGLVKWAANADNFGGAIADTATQIFKRAKLVRAGYGLRRVTDGMLQMAAHAYSGPLTHPFHYATIVAGASPESRLGKIIDAIQGPYEGIRQAFLEHAGITLPEGYNRALMNSVTGSILQDDTMFRGNIQDANMNDFLNLSRKNQAMMPERMLAGFTTIPSHDASAPDAWLEELSRIRRSEMMTELLKRSGDPAAAHEWFLNGPGRAFREEMATDPKFADLLTNDNVARAHVDDVLGRLNLSLGGERIGAPHPDLVNYVNTGRLNQASNNAVDIVHGGYHQIGPEDLAGYRDFMPSQLRARQEFTLPNAIKAKHRFTQGIDSLLNTTATRPDNYLVRGPVWKGAYWEDNRGGVPLLHEFSSADVQAKTIEEARLAHVRPDILEALQRTPPHVGAGTITSSDELHALAGMYATKSTNTMLHNFAQRNQVFDSLRNVAPFGDAWRQIIQRWGQAAALNPKVLLRLEQGMRSAKGAGIFVKDPSTGQEVFSLPGTQWLTKQITGVPVPLQGSVDGLSMLGQVYPGVGPTLTLPTYYLQNKMGLGDPSAANDALHSVLFPYGTAGYDNNPIFGSIQQMLPNWAAHVSHMWDTPTTSREYASTLEGAVDYLASSGRYDLHGANAQAEMSRLIADAHSAANVLELIRGGAAFFSPTAPIPKQVILDKHNQLQELMKVRQDYYTHQQKDGSTKAYQWLLDTYGPGAFTAATPWSTNPSGSIVPRTAAGYDFAAAHSWMAQVAPDVYGALIPESGNPDLTAYDMSFRNGTRVPATPADRIKLANNRLASYQYDKWAAAHPDATTDDRNQKKTELKAGFPGYQDQPINYNRVPNEIAQLKALVNDPRAAATPQLAHTVQFVKQYLAFRDQAIKAGKTKTLKSNSAAGPRAWLINSVARDMYTQDTGFAKAWDTLLKYEFPKQNTNFKNAGPLGAGGPGAGGMYGPGQAPPDDPRFRALPVSPTAPPASPPGGVVPVAASTTPTAPTQATTENAYAGRDAAGNVIPGAALQAQFGDRASLAQQTPVAPNLEPGTKDYAPGGERPAPAAKKASTKKSGGGKAPKKKPASKGYTFGK